MRSNRDPAARPLLARLKHISPLAVACCLLVVLRGELAAWYGMGRLPMQTLLVQCGLVILMVLAVVAITPLVGRIGSRLLRGRALGWRLLAGGLTAGVVLSLLTPVALVLVMLHPTRIAPT